MGVICKGISAVQLSHCSLVENLLAVFWRHCVNIVFLKHGFTSVSCCNSLLFMPTSFNVTVSNA